MVATDRRRRLSIIAVLGLAVGLLGIGVRLTPPAKAQTASPECTDTDGNGNVDNDGDGLCDNWEDSGITVGNATFTLPNADKNRKNLYIEFDYMAGHKPLDEAIKDVVDVFANAPVTGNGTNGIVLTVVIDEQVPHQDVITGLPTDAQGAEVPCAANPPADSYCAIKKAQFGTAAERAQGADVLAAKRYAFRYGVWAHNVTVAGSLGEAFQPGDDEIMTLGSFSPASNGHNNGSRNAQAGTFLHEFGHSVGVKHGGQDEVNCKPNHLSVINYNFTIDDVPSKKRPLDLSRVALGDLDETKLDESVGIPPGPTGATAPTGVEIAYGPNPPSLTIVDAAQKPIDWNRNGQIDPGPVTANLNGNPGITCDTNNNETLLKGAEDWSSLTYGTKASVALREGLQNAGTVQQRGQMRIDPGHDAFAAIAGDYDGDGVNNLDDDCIFEANANQGDGDADGQGDVCEDNLPPGVDAGPDQSGTTGNALRLSGALSSDGDIADALLTSWTYKPAAGNGRCSIADPRAVVTTVTCLDPGSYLLTLDATDRVTVHVSDSAMLTVTSPAGGGGTPTSGGGTTPSTPTFGGPFFPSGGPFFAASGPTVTLSSPTVTPGEQTILMGSGFQPGESLQATLFSAPVVLATFTVGPNGTFAVPVTIPLATDPGAHQLVVSRPTGPAAATSVYVAGPNLIAGSSGGWSQQQQQSIVTTTATWAPASTPPAAAAPAAAQSGRVAFTGAAVRALLLTAAFALALGCALVLMSRRGGSSSAAR